MRRARQAKRKDFETAAGRSLYEAVKNGVKDQLAAKFEKRTARVGVTGLGYVGLPLALLFSEEGCAATGSDIEGKKVETLTQGALISAVFQEVKFRLRTQGDSRRPPIVSMLGHWTQLCVNIAG